MCVCMCTCGCVRVLACESDCEVVRPGVRFNAGLKEVSYMFEECLFRTVCCMDKR